MTWDLLVRGGQVIDPATGWDAPADVAIAHGRVAAVEPELPVEKAADTVDATGRLVTPGLVDLHTHVWHGGGYWGIDPEPVAWRTGVTTWVDAGSAGAYTIDGLRRHVAGPAAVRIAALLNISAIGLVGESYEHAVLDHLDVDLGVRAAARHGDIIRGVKARIDTRSVGEHGLEPLRRAATLARRIERPLMVHIGYAPPTVAEIVPYLRAGDILTHCATGCSRGVVTGSGTLTDAARRAADEGVVFDLGHGAGAFAFDHAEAQLAAGLTPTISTDLHQRAAHGPAFDLPTVMGKMLAIGMSVSAVVEAATVRPARALGLPDGVGTLAVGAPADVAIFDAEEGRFPLVDIHGAMRTAPLQLTNVGTYVAGRLLPPRAADPPPPWVPLSEAQRDADARRVRGIRDAARPRLTRAEDFLQPYARAEVAADASDRERGQ